MSKMLGPELKSYVNRTIKEARKNNAQLSSQEAEDWMEDPRYKNLMKIMRVLGYSPDQPRDDPDRWTTSTTSTSNTISTDLLSTTSESGHKD